MTPKRTTALHFFAALLVAGCVQTAPQAERLPGTSWQLVRFEGGDDTVLTPDEKAKYTIAFAADVRPACAYACDVPARLAARPFGQALAVHPFLRSRLFLSLMADGGIHEFEAAR